MTDVFRFVRWQCSLTGTHRGWREPGEPRGLCDLCFAVTRWEEEAASVGVREGAPGHLLPENRFPDLYPQGAPTA